MARRHGMPQLRESNRAQPYPTNKPTGFREFLVKPNYGHAGTMRQAAAPHRAVDARINKVTNPQVVKEHTCQKPGPLRPQNTNTIVGTVVQQADKKRRREGEVELQEQLPKLKDPQLMTRYRADIMADLRACQNMYAPSNYVHKLQEVTSVNRTILVDWLLEIHYKYHMHTESLYFGIGLLDRYLDMKPSTRRKIVQVVGVCCLLLGAKFEEVDTPPTISDIVAVMGYAGTTDEVRQYECEVFNALEHELYVPTPFQFMLNFVDQLEIPFESDLFYLAMFFLDCTLLDAQFLVLTPEQRAAAAIYLACSKMGVSKQWSRSWDFPDEKVRYWAVSLNAWFPRYRHMAVFRKFQRPGFKSVIQYS